MSTSCDSNCAGCADSSCEERQQESMIEPLHELSNVKNVIAVVSGKGGVGKSLVTSLMAVIMQRRGKRTAVLDADITGPSIPKTFQVTEKASGTEDMIFPVNTKTGIQLMSVNLLLDDETDPVVWRGPVIAGAVKQFWTDVIWKDVDYMFVDMPPGTGDVPLTVFQSLPVKGIIVVTSPQELVSMIVEKSCKDGGDDEDTRLRHCGEYVVLSVPGLRCKAQHFRREPYRRDSGKIRNQPYSTDSGGSETVRCCGCRHDRAV